MSAAGSSLAVIGVGNVLLGDDGAGVRVVDVLRARTGVGDAANAADPGLPPRTRLIDGGTLGLDLVRQLDGVRGLVLVDAGDRGDAPGTVTVHHDADAIAAATAGNAGGHGVGELLAVARMLGALPTKVSIVEVAITRTAIGVGLSPDVEAAVPAAVEAIRRELATMDPQDAGGSRRCGAEPAGASA